MSNEEAQEKAMELANKLAFEIAQENGSTLYNTVLQMLLYKLNLARLLAAEAECDKLKAEHALRDIGFAGMVKQRNQLRAELSEAQKQFGLCSVCNKAAWVTRADGKLEDCEVCRLRAELEQARKWLAGRPSETLYQNRVEEIKLLRAELEQFKKPLDIGESMTQVIVRKNGELEKLRSELEQFKLNEPKKVKERQYWSNLVKQVLDELPTSLEETIDDAIVRATTVIRATKALRDSNAKAYDKLSWQRILDQSLTTYDQAEKGGGE